MSVSRKLGLSALLVWWLPSAVAQTGGDRIAAITSALRAREFDRAIQLLQPALRQLPQSAQLWTLQGIALSGKGSKKEALSSFHSALGISPEYLPALEGAAELEYEAGSSSAVPRLQHLIELRPREPTSHAMLAVLLSRRGDCAAAVPHFEQSGPLLDSQPGALRQYGACLVRLKKLDEAIAAFRRMLALNPADRDARHHVATIQLMAEHPKDAIETLAPLLQANDPNVQTLELAAAAYEANGETPEAVRVLRQAIISDPRNLDLYVDFVNISLDHQSFQAGISMINSGIALQPQAAQLYVARGVLYVQLGLYDQAEADFGKADALDPGQAIGSVALGVEAVQRNSPERALATVRSKLANKPNDAYLLFLYADILNQKGLDAGSAEFQSALASVKKSVALQPGLGTAHDLLAKLYLQTGQNREAIEQSRKALTIDAKDQTAVYHLIQALRKTGDTSELPDLLKRLAQLRQAATRQEEQHHRYQLIEGSAAPAQP